MGTTIRRVAGQLKIVRGELGSGAGPTVALPTFRLLGTPAASTAHPRLFSDPFQTAYGYVMRSWYMNIPICRRRFPYVWCRALNTLQCLPTSLIHESLVGGQANKNHGPRATPFICGPALANEGATKLPG